MLCPAVVTEEKFLHPESIATCTYPVDVTTLSKCVRIEAVAQSIVEGGVAVVDESKQTCMYACMST